jgi:hypothetical protein
MHSHVTAHLEAGGAECIAARILEDAADAVEVGRDPRIAETDSALGAKPFAEKARRPTSAPLRDKASAPGFLKLP